MSRRRFRNSYERLYAKGAILILFCFISGLIATVGVGIAQPIRQTRIDFSGREEWERFFSINRADYLEVKPGVFAKLAIGDEQIADLQREGFGVTVEIEDLERCSAAQMRGDGGNFGLFHSYSEIGKFLDSLHTSYPEITTDKRIIGITHEDREIWAMKISDNPEVDEEEPEVLFDGLHHANEIPSQEVVLGYMEWLCEGYGVNGEATYLVDEREIWFVPCVNPDGSVYNESVYPEGGGMWRKNRRDNGDGTYGVDLNRNYPYKWGGAGSSDDPSSNYYSGPWAGSEPEVQAMMDLMAEHRFVCHCSFHTFASAVWFPWSYTDEPTLSHSLFTRWVQGLTRYNGYEHCQGGTWRLISGTSKDYAFARLPEKNSIFSCTVELRGAEGSIGPWDESHIPVCRADCLPLQLYNTWVGGEYAGIADPELTGTGSNGRPDPGETVGLTVKAENLSLSCAVENVEITLASDDPYLRIERGMVTWESIPFAQNRRNEDDPFVMVIDSDTPEDHVVTVRVETRVGGACVIDTLEWLIGPIFVRFEDDMESDFEIWERSGGFWKATSEECHSPTLCYTDSPGLPYLPGTDTWIEMIESIDMSEASGASLSFWHRYETEEWFDFCYVEASRDGGETWEELRRYDGANESWEEERIDLEQYLGCSLFTIRFRLNSDGRVEKDGWYIDDVVISEPVLTNHAPGVPELLYPGNGAELLDEPSPVLVVGGSEDPDSGDVITYGFRVYRDELCTDMVTSAEGVSGDDGEAEWCVDECLTDGRYWWRSYGDDGKERGLMSKAATFTVETSETGLPTELMLEGARPNPFGEATEIRYELPGRSRMKLLVYDLMGREVAVVEEGERGPGRLSGEWDGRNGRGAVVSNGIYMIRLYAGGESRVRPVVLLR